MILIEGNPLVLRYHMWEAFDNALHHKISFKELEKTHGPVVAKKIFDARDLVLNDHAYPVRFTDEGLVTICDPECVAKAQTNCDAMNWLGYERKKAIDYHIPTDGQPRPASFYFNIPTGKNKY